MDFVSSLEKINILDSGIAGGKGASLGEMIQAGIPIPPGFVLLVDAFFDFLAKGNVNERIESLIGKIDWKDSNSVYGISTMIRDLIVDTEMSDGLSATIIDEFNKLRADRVAIRSSATAEDSAVASWAGELETFLNTDKMGLIKNIKNCWASLFSSRALLYAFEKKIITIGVTKNDDLTRTRGTVSNYPVGVAVIVQKMIDSEISGICFTADPINKDDNQMVIEAGWGLGEAIVSGQITPDNYIVSRDEDLIWEVNVNSQEKMIIRGKNGIKTIKVAKNKINLQKLSGRQIIELANLCRKIENHYKSPQDIEWALSNNKFYITQSRPITTL